MSSVTLRAEQALLGALLTQQQQERATAMQLLRAEDFGQRLHRQLFTTIRDLTSADPALTGPRLIDAVATRTGTAPDLIQNLADGAPTPAHATAYAQMIQVAAFRREIADASQALAQSLATNPTRLTNSGIPAVTPAPDRWPEPQTQPAPGAAGASVADVVSDAEHLHRVRVLAAMERQVEIYSTLASTPDTSPDNTPAIPPALSPGLTPEASAQSADRSPADPPEQSPDPEPATATATDPQSATQLVTEPDSTADSVPDSVRAPETTSPSGSPERERSYLEDLLLADLLRNPDQSDALATFLPDSTFTDGQRREIYQTILTTAHAGQPIDDVIIAWQVELLRATTRLTADGPGDPQLPATPAYVPGAGAEPDLVYLNRLAGTDSPRSAIEIGRRLLTDDMTALLHANVSRIAHTPTPTATPTTEASATRTQETRTQDAQPAPRPLPSGPARTGPAPLNPSLRPPGPEAPATAPRPTPRPER